MKSTKSGEDDDDLGAPWDSTASMFSHGIRRVPCADGQTSTGNARADLIEPDTVSSHVLECS